MLLKIWFKCVTYFSYLWNLSRYMCIQKQPPRGVPRKRCCENMQQIYRRTPWRSAISIKLLCKFIEIALRHGCSPVNLLHVFRTPFPRNTSEWLLLYFHKLCLWSLKKKDLFRELVPEICYTATNYHSRLNISSKHRKM